MRMLSLEAANGDFGATKSIAIAYDPGNSDESARQLICALRPEWRTSPGEIEFVRFKEGITNTLFKAIKRRPGYSDHQIDGEAVLLRAYGNGTAILIDREREASSHLLLAKHGLAPPLLARFENGLLYSYIEGTACTPEDMRGAEISRLTACRLGQWHAILNPAELTDKESESKYPHISKLLPGKPLPNIWTSMQRWINALPSETAAQRQRNAELQHEMESCVVTLGSVPGLDDGRYVISHSDLLCGNIIMQNDGGKQDVNFIDYEYAVPAPAAFDLANYFSEWGGFECDFNALPTRKQRRDVLQHYVASYRTHQQQLEGNHVASGMSVSNLDGPASNDMTMGLDVDQLFGEVDQFRGIPGLFWGIWALIQATISQIDFDYASYAEIRLGEYWACKGEQDGSRGRKGEEMPLRERRWAQEE